MSDTPNEGFGDIDPDDAVDASDDENSSGPPPEPADTPDE